MSTSPIEITATFLRERHRFTNDDGDTIIATAWANSEINSEITIKGPADADELKPEQSYRFYGHWTEYKNRRSGETEQQFAFTTFVRQAPATRVAVINYLCDAGSGHGFGRSRAAKVWEEFGSESVQVFRETPLKVVAMLAKHPRLGISVENADAIAASLQEDAALEGCTLDLMDLLTGRGFPKSTSREAVKLWGNRAAAVIRRDPYRLMNFRGCGFKRCDALYLQLGLPPARLKRQALAAWYKLASNTEGHTWFPLAYGEQGIRETIAGTELRIDDARRLARIAKATAELWEREGSIVPAGVSSSMCWIAEGKNSQHEWELAQAVADAMAEESIWPDVADIQKISDHQRENLRLALSGGPIAILGGSPGTGKTYAAAALIGLLVKTIGLRQIAVAAPTGKAAVRISEAMNAYGLDLRARTLHSLLGQCNDNPMPYEVLVVDESSMIDTDLAAWLFRQRAKGTHILFVGDINQLPPVGHGAPLRDLIAAGLPYGELREIVRNSGGIVEACAAIRDGQRWEPGDNLKLFTTGNADDQIDCLRAVIGKIIAARRNPVWETQVLVAVNKKSPLARRTLNELLQDLLNPAGKVMDPTLQAALAGDGLAADQRKRHPFRRGDKIVNTANGWFTLCDADDQDSQLDDLVIKDDGKAYVANGELAKVLTIEDKCFTCELSAPKRVIRVPRGPVKESAEPDDEAAGSEASGGENDKDTGTGCSWELGYALSCHKSQGSEWPFVIVVLDEYPGARLVCSREWLFTAISRAKEKCILIGKRDVADQFCRRVALRKRKTFLRERILLARAKDELANL